MKASLSALIAAALLTSVALADDPTTKPTTAPAAAYPLTVCAISGESLPAEGTITKMIDGREVKFCCKKCVGAFEKDPEAAHKKMDEKIIEAGKDAYPLKECLVSGEELGSMGKPVMYVHRPTNQLVEFCCSSCIKQFQKKPEPYLEKLSKAAK